MIYNIAELGVYLHNLKRTHSGDWKSLCPFHSESTGSFFINEFTGLWHCFGCGEHGDINRLYIHLGIGPVDIISGNIIPEKDYTWHELMKFPVAVDNEYLIKDRHLTNEIIKLYDLRDTGSGIFIPAKDLTNTIIGGTIRYYSGSGRYKRVNSIDAYPSDRILKHERLFIVEGPFGVMNAHMHGYENVITGYGSKAEFKEYMKLLKRKSITVIYDDDEPGYEGAKNLLKLSDYTFGIAIPGKETDEWNWNMGLKITHSIKEIDNVIQC